MKLLLCSDFSGVGFRFLKKFFKETKGLNCLFVGYANDDEDDELESGAATRFKLMGMNVFSLTENYDFSDKIDIVFVRGGNTTRLIHLLRQYGQYNKIKDLVEKQGALYIGSSAGSVLAGTDTEYTLEAEPYEPDLKPLFGDDALKGFGWIDKLVFVHCNKYVMMYEKVNDKYEFFRVPDTFCYPAYLVDKKKFKRGQYLKIDNNAAFMMNGKTCQMLKFNWRHLPVKEYVFED